MRRHTAGECNGVHIFTETIGDKPECRSESTRRGSLFSIYIFKNRTWVKIGEYCDTCGFHFNGELLGKLFGDSKESVKTTIEIEGKQVPHVYSHEFPRKFNFSLMASQLVNTAIVPVGNVVPKKPDAQK